MRGQFLVPNNKPNYPPILLINLSKRKNDNLYSYIKTLLSGEMFLRVRRVHSKYSKIILNSLSDLILDTEGHPVYDKCKINLDLDIDPVDDIIKARLDISPIWLIGIVSQKEYITFAVEKKSEVIVKRRVVQI